MRTPIASFAEWVAPFLSRLCAWGGPTLVFTCSALAIMAHAASIERSSISDIAIVIMLATAALSCAVKTTIVARDALHDHRLTFVPGHRAWIMSRIAERNAKLHRYFKYTVDVAMADTATLVHMRDANPKRSAPYQILNETIELRRRLDHLRRSGKP